MQVALVRAKDLDLLGQEDWKHFINYCDKAVSDLADFFSVPIHVYVQRLDTNPLELLEDLRERKTEKC